MRCRAADRELIHRVRSRGKLDCRVVGVYRKAANLLDPEGRIITAVLHRPEPVPGGFSLLLPEETPWPESLKPFACAGKGRKLPESFPWMSTPGRWTLLSPRRRRKSDPRQTQVLANFLAEPVRRRHCFPAEQGGGSCIPPTGTRLTVTEGERVLAKLSGAFVRPEH